ncbi:MAG TPA: hypothetical protein VNT79_02795 [Phycisphaerae bacterium]|nr:hypothetical protein [Phycisphaerae bacterium]
MLKRGMMRWMLAAGFSVTALSGGALRAVEPTELLKLVPEDAWGFLMLRSIGTVDERAAYIKELLNLPIPGELTPFALAQLGITPADENPIDMKSPLCIVLLDAQKFGAAEGSPIPDFQSATVVIVPAKDGKALLKKLNVGEESDGISQGMLGPDEIFAAVKGDHVILGKKKDSVLSVFKSSTGYGDGMAKARTTVAGDSDIYVSLALGGVVKAYESLISTYMQGMAAVLGPQGKDLEKIQKMLSQMKALDISINVAKDGVALRYLIEAQSGTDLEAMLKDAKTTADPLLARLPKEKYLMASGALMPYSEHSAKFGEQTFVQAILQSGQVEGFDEAAVKTIDAELLKMLKSILQVAVSVSEISATGGAGGMFGVTLVIETKDSEAFVASVRTVWDNAWKIKADKEFEDVKKHFTHEADAETVGENKVDTITLKIQELADEAQWDEDDMKSFKAILGDDVVIRFGAADSKHVVFTFGGGKSRHQTVAKAVSGSGSDSLATEKGIKEIGERLPSPRTGEAFIAIDTIINSVKAAAKAAGEEEDEAIPFDVPVINAPLALSTMHDGGVQRGDLYVPTKLIVAMKKAYDDQMKADAMTEFDEEEGDEEEDGAAEEESSEDEPSEDSEEDEATDE